MENFAMSYGGSYDGTRRSEPVSEDRLRDACVVFELFATTCGIEILRWPRIPTSGVPRIFDYEGWGHVRSKATVQSRRGVKTDWKYDGSFTSYRR